MRAWASCAVDLPAAAAEARLESGEVRGRAISAFACRCRLGGQALRLCRLPRQLAQPLLGAALRHTLMLLGGAARLAGVVEHLLRRR